MNEGTVLQVYYDAKSQVSKSRSQAQIGGPPPHHAEPPYPAAMRR